MSPTLRRYEGSVTETPEKPMHKPKIERSTLDPALCIVFAVYAYL